ncbi:MAG TPA: hydantoinase/oxoprolinase family protein, partial [Nocardioidaceae bacterium]|nr:hydantoinase/oxoprolinase family protein [Nocardioidaceae bacterium]
MYRLGVDVGGTFTDVMLVEGDSGRVLRTKVPSTPADQSVGVLDGVTQILGIAGVGADRVAHFLHGTTVATNAVLERKGARVGLITTVGYRQIIHIGRSFVPGGLGGWIVWDRPAPLVDLEDVLEVPGRIDARGEEIAPLDEAAVREAARRLAGRGIEALTIAFINSYVNPDHELRAKRIVAEELPGIPVSASAEILPELGEFDRALTTVANAYVRPVVSSYLDNLDGQLSTLGVPGERRVLRSDGGLSTFDRAAELPVSLLMSGPAGGVGAALALGPAAGHPDLLTVDMGGTSTDVALIQDASAVVRRETTVHDLVVRAPSVDVHTVGAGGGSIAHVPELTGGLRVGPASAGADPGPAAYGRGGRLPTVTDANVVLGYLPQSLLGGRMQLDVEAAHQAVGSLASQLGLSVEDAAAAVIDLVNEGMLGALRLVSVQRGYDPSDFALFVFGGAGPLHGNALAELLGAWPVIIPPSPGVLCAFGDASTGLRAEASRSLVRRLVDAEVGQLQQTFTELTEAVDEELRAAGVTAAGRTLRFEADVRYHGQGFEVSVDAGDPATPGMVDRIRAVFAEAHQRLFGFTLEEDLEVIVVRVIGSAESAKIVLPELERGGAAPDDALLGTQRMYVGGAWTDARLYDRSALRAGNVVEGPAIVVEMDSTTLVRPGHVAKVDAVGNLLISPASTHEG